MELYGSAEKETTRSGTLTAGGRVKQQMSPCEGKCRNPYKIYLYLYRRIWSVAGRDPDLKKPMGIPVLATKRG